VIASGLQLFLNLLYYDLKVTFKEQNLKVDEYTEKFPAFSENYIAKLVSREKDGFVENWTKWRIFLGE
jgi:hypothetical protein